VKAFFLFLGRFLNTFIGWSQATFADYAFVSSIFKMAATFVSVLCLSFFLFHKVSSATVVARQTVRAFGEKSCIISELVRTVSAGLFAPSHWRIQDSCRCRRGSFYDSEFQCKADIVSARLETITFRIRARYSKIKSIFATLSTTFWTTAWSR